MGTVCFAMIVLAAIHLSVDETGRLLLPNLQFFGMTAGSGEHYTMGDRIGNIGMTVGRTDIKY